MILKFSICGDIFQENNEKYSKANINGSETVSGRFPFILSVNIPQKIMILINARNVSGVGYW